MLYITFAFINKFNIENSLFYNVIINSFIIGGTFLISYLSYTYLELYFLILKRKVSSVLSGNN